MKSVFLSYAQENSPTVVRAYQDLARAGGDTQIWCYEVSSRLGVDYRDEFRSRVVESSHFVLFDSEYARRSEYAREELSLWLSSADRKPFICRLQEEGDWVRHELVPNHNRLTYLNFTKYESGMRSLCEALQMTYRPTFSAPRDQDFDIELQRYLGILDARSRQDLVDRYERFVVRCDASPTVAEAQLVVLIDDYLEAVPRVVTPLLALGAIQMQRGGVAEAMKTYQRVCVRSPADPRGWRGLADARSSAGDHSGAVGALRECIKRIEQSQLEEHRIHLLETRINIAIKLFVSGQVDVASEELEGLSYEQKASAEVACLLAQIAWRQGRRGEAASHASDAAAAIDAGHALDPSSIRDRCLELAEVFRLLGEELEQNRILGFARERYPYDSEVLSATARALASDRRLAEAEECYRSALRFNPTSVRILTEFALVCRAQGKTEDSQSAIRKCLELDQPAARVEYFLGLAHFMEDRRETAKYYFDKSQRDRAIKLWPWYEQLLS